MASDVLGAWIAWTTATCACITNMATSRLTVAVAVARAGGMARVCMVWSMVGWWAGACCKVDAPEVYKGSAALSAFSCAVASS